MYDIAEWAVTGLAFYFEKFMAWLAKQIYWAVDFVVDAAYILVEFVWNRIVAAVGPAVDALQAKLSEYGLDIDLAGMVGAFSGISGIFENASGLAAGVLWLIPIREMLTLVGVAWGVALTIRLGRWLFAGFRVPFFGGGQG